MSNLDRDLAEMKRLGYTSYGKYKLDYPNTNPDPPKKKKTTVSKLCIIRNRMQIFMITYAASAGSLLQPPDLV